VQRPGARRVQCESYSFHLATEPGISTVDVYHGLGNALAKKLGQANVLPFDLKPILKFYRTAVKKMIEGTAKRVDINDVYNSACKSLIVNVLQTMPDLIIYITGQYIPQWVPAMIRDRLHIKQAVWFTESPYQVALEARMAPLFDYVFTCDKACERIYRGFNPNTWYLPTAYDSLYEWEVTDELKRWERIIYTPDLFFVGSEVPGRLDFLRELVSHLKGQRLRFRMFGVFPSIEEGKCPELEPFYTPRVLTKFDVIKYYRWAKIVLNHFRINESKSFYRDAKTGQVVRDPEGKVMVRTIEPYSLSPRVYEALAAGGFLLTQKRTEIGDLFVPGQDLVTYDDAADCARMVREWLPKENERREIADSGRHKVEQGHDYLDRAARLLDAIHFM